MKNLIKRVLSLMMVGCCIFSMVACKDGDGTSSYDSEAESVCSHTYTSKIVKMATCGELGAIIYTCRDCGDSYTEEIVPTGNHSFTSAITKETSCKECGIETYTCLICGNSYNKEIEKTDDHEYKGTVTKEATDTVAGERTFTCSICGDSYIDWFKLSTVKFSPISHDIRLENVFGDYAGRVFCEVKSAVVSQDNVITSVRIKYVLKGITASSISFSYYIEVGNSKVKKVSEILSSNEAQDIDGERVIFKDIKLGYRMTEGKQYLISLDD